MAQVYARLSGQSSRDRPAPPTTAAPTSAPATTTTTTTTEKRECAAVDFAHKRDTLLTSIQTTSDLVSSLSNFNSEKWTIRYPHQQLGFVDTSSAVNPSSPASSDKRSDIRRATSLYGERDVEVAPTQNTSPARPSLQSRAFTAITPWRNNSSIDSTSKSKDDGFVAEQGSSNSKTAAHATAPNKHPLSIDLRLGAPGQTSIPALMESMSQATIAQLLSKRFDSAQQQLASLSSRVKDNKSRILITGDLNSGKSTFVNALLRRNILPTDQQPLTNVFCEVLDAQTYNEGKEEVHAILAADLEKYNRKDSSTFDKYPLDKLEEIATVDNEDQQYGMVKVYLEDSRSPIDSTITNVVEHQTTAEKEAAINKSFIRNGIVSISLIDGPGLNKDSDSTISLFSKQSEIDVIVFVAEAANSITQSSNEFLWNASIDKAYLFIVVNKFKSIRNKDKLVNKVHSQIKALSPQTFENRQDLIHFVESEDIVKKAADIISQDKETVATKEDEDFTNLEESLRSFLLHKRSISKLTPAKHYLINLLSNLATVADTNLHAADAEIEEAQERLALVKPIHEKLSREREIVEESVGKEEEDRVELVKAQSIKILKSAVDTVSTGLTSAMVLPEYPGLLGLWDWANEVKQTLLDFVELSVESAEEDARVITTEGVKRVTGELATQFLPSVEEASRANSSAGGAANALPQRVFRPEVMFAKRRQLAKKRKAQTNPSLANSDKHLALLTPGSTEVDISFMDMFDLDRLLSYTRLHLPGAPSSHTYFKQNDSGKAVVEATSALSVASLGLGAVTMFGTKVVGLKSVIEAITTTLEVLGSKAARKWAGPVAGVLTVCLAAYIIHDLPRAIPHNIGKKMHAQLMQTGFTEAESERISKETRKVMRLAGWDLRERFRAALEASEKDRRAVEGRLRKANEALEFLDRYLDDVDATERKVKEIEL